MRLSWLIALLGMALLSSCTSFIPRDKDQLDYLQRLQTQHDGEVEVSAVVLSSQESGALFGPFISETGVQPVWMRIRNNSQTPYWFYSIGLDPNYFSPHEAAWKNHLTFGGLHNIKMDSTFRELQIHHYVPPNETISGFVYTRLDEGVKPVTIDLKSPGEEGKSFFFTMPVPGLSTSDKPIDYDALYSDSEMLKIETLAELRAWIEKLSCCVFGEDGVSPGDPLNLVLIGDRDAFAPAFIQRDWHLAERVHLGALWKMAKSFLFGAYYRYSPVSPLYQYGRSHDVALQKARNTINERNHLRLWLAPAQFQGEDIWVGQISRDIGVRLTGRISPPTTHVIDPEVDEARWYLAQDLAYSQRIDRIGLAAGVGRAPTYEPRENLLGDPYYTDGYRLVAFFTNKPTSFSQIQALDWEEPADLRYMNSEKR